MKPVTARYEGIDVVLECLERETCHRLNKLLEYGRAADDMIFGIELLHMRTSLLTLWKEMSAPPDGTTTEFKSCRSKRTVHDALEEISVPAEV